MRWWPNCDDLQGILQLDIAPYYRDAIEEYLKDPAGMEAEYDKLYNESVYQSVHETSSKEVAWRLESIEECRRNCIEAYNSYLSVLIDWQRKGGVTNG